MPINYKNYPPNWKEIRAAILDRAGHACEGSPAYPECRARNYQPHPVTGSKVILTVAHLDHDTTHNDPQNLRAWCQRCHLTYDIAHHRDTRERSRSVPVEYEYFEQVRLMREVAQYTDWQYPELALLHASANGMKRDRTTGAKLKASGVKAGVPDLFLPVARSVWHGLFIEMKATYPDGSHNQPSTEQKKWIAALREQGYRVEVCYTWEQAMGVLLDYLREE